MTHCDGDETSRRVHAQLLEACEDAYTHLCILCAALGELTNKSDVELLDKLARAIRAGGGRIIDARGKEER